MATALDAVVCGATWHYGRQGHERKCHRCGENDTPWHAYWACPSLEHHTDENVKKTNNLKKKFEDRNSPYYKAECLWGRAIMPNNIVDTKDDDEYNLENENTKQTHNYQNMLEQTSNVATDGSGGPGWAHKSLRKVAAASAIIQYHNEGVTKASIKVTGVNGRQTVPRVETRAIIMVKEDLKKVNCKATKTTIWSDAEYAVTSSSQDQRRKSMNGPNADLWANWHQDKKTKY